MPLSTARNIIERNYKSEALKATELIKTLSASGALAYAFSLRVVPVDWEIAHAAGRSRTLIAKARGRNSDQYRRGADDERIDTEGLLVEWLLGTALGPGGWTIAPLVEYRPNAEGVDLTSPTGEAIDAKSVSQSKTTLYINCSQHTRKKPAAYLVGRIVSEELVDFYVVGAHAVEGWRVYSGFSPCYSQPLPKRIPLPVEEEEASRG